MTDYILMFILGYAVRSLFAFYLHKKRIIDLQTYSENGGYLPIIIECDINNKGGYTCSIFNQKGIHKTKEYHKKFIELLKSLIEHELLKETSKPPVKFKLLNFKKDD